MSTSEQALGPEAQRAAIEAYAEREGIEIVAWHSDIGVSGGAALDQRPGLLAALDDAKATRAKMIIVAKRCRLARDVVVAATVERAAARVGATVVSADGVGVGDGPEAELLRRIVDAVAAYERALIRGRTKAALAAKKRRGEHVGGLEYGQTLAADGTVVVDDDEADAVERIRTLRGEGLSIRRIASTLDAERVPCRGRAWRPATVHAIVRRLESDAA